MQKIINKKFNNILLAAGILISGISACSSSDNEKVIIPPVTEQAPEEPEYGTTFLSRPPYPVPENDEVRKTQKLSTSHEEITISAKNKYVEDIAKDIGKMTGYRPYVSAFIAKKRITLEISGDIDSVCAKVANESKSSVSVDHIAKEIRFVAGVSPKL